MPVAMSAPALSALRGVFSFSRGNQRPRGRMWKQSNCIHNGVKVPDSHRFMLSVLKRGPEMRFSLVRGEVDMLSTIFITLLPS